MSRCTCRELQVGADLPGQYYAAIAGVSQPERLSDSSRWSQRSEDHRIENEIDPHLEHGARKPWHPSRVQKSCSLVSGGRSVAKTTGYYLTAFQAETHGTLVVPAASTQTTLLPE